MTDLPPAPLLRWLRRGDIVTGTVTEITPFWVTFVDIGGFTAFINIPELSWRPFNHPTDVVTIGQQITAEVLDIDMDRSRVALSLKALQQDPLLEFPQHVGTVVTGPVTKVVPFGRFVRVEDAPHGFEGLLHESQLNGRTVDYAVEAAERADVQHFRTEALADNLVAWEELDAWITRQERRDGPRTHDMQLTFTTSDRSPHWVPGLAEIESAVSTAHHSVRSLEFNPQGSEWQRVVAVSAGGVLDTLRVLAHRLGGHFGWQPAQAVSFVVCDVLPLMSAIRVGINNVMNRPDLARVTLTVHPSATPVEVARAYRNARKATGGHRPRALSVKHVRLAAFVYAEHRQQSWAERRRIWNEQFPQWWSSQDSNFRRDALKAVRAICRPAQPAFPDDDTPAGR